MEHPNGKTSRGPAAQRRGVQGDVRRDERVSLPLDPETALRALLRVDPGSPQADTDPEPGEEGQWEPES